jgi:hypothetical protein
MRKVTHWVTIAYAFVHCRLLKKVASIQARRRAKDDK